MPVLFDIEPGRPAEPAGLHPADAHHQAERLLGAETFRSFNACEGAYTRPLVAEFVRSLKGLNLGLHDMLTVNVGVDVRPVLGFDLVRGKAGPTGTEYERPVARNAAEVRHGGLEGKTFGYVPLEGVVDIEAVPGRPLELAPGQALVPEDAQHTIRIPAGNMLLELIMTHSAAGPGCEAEWSRYSAAQPNPNM